MERRLRIILSRLECHLPMPLLWWFGGFYFFQNSLLFYLKRTANRTSALDGGGGGEPEPEPNDRPGRGWRTRTRTGHRPGGVGEPELESPQHRRRANKAVRAGQQQARGAVHMYAAWPPFAMLAPATALPPSSCINAASASVIAAPSASSLRWRLVASSSLRSDARRIHSALLGPLAYRHGGSAVGGRFANCEPNRNSGGRALREPRTEPNRRGAPTSRNANRKMGTFSRI